MSEQKKPLPYKCQHKFGAYDQATSNYVCSECGLQSASTGRLDCMIAERHWLVRAYENLLKAKA